MDRPRADAPTLYQKTVVHSCHHHVVWSCIHPHQIEWADVLKEIANNLCPWCSTGLGSDLDCVALEQTPFVVSKVQSCDLTPFDRAEEMLLKGQKRHDAIRVFGPPEVTFDRNAFDHLAYSTPRYIALLEQWKKETLMSWAIFYREEEEIVSFALFRRCDFDPLKTHTKPCWLTFIWTDPNHKGKGYASSLLEWAKERYQFSLAPNDTSARTFFVTRGCVERNGVLRYPA